MDQTEIFRSGEGDNWFARNAPHLGGSAAGDHVGAAVERLAAGSGVGSVCEIGCANGWRLGALAERLPRSTRLAGSDVSAMAIEAGRQRWPGIDLRVGAADAPNLDRAFDVVIVSFVLHWVARPKLAASIAAIDALVRDGGHLVLADFLPDRPCARRYHHRDDVELFTYKQDYAACFEGLGFYAAVERELYAHGGGSVADEQDRAVCAVLRKSFDVYRKLG